MAEDNEIIETPFEDNIQNVTESEEPIHWQCYAYIWNNEKLNGFGQCPMSGDNVQSVEISNEIFNALCEDPLLYVWDPENSQVMENPNYEQDKEQQYREEMLQRTLTPSDVERALYKAKGMDFEDLKTFIHERMPQIDVKAIAIELRANDFFRGATLNGQNLFDTLGALLGYTPQDIDYLFVHKELPVIDN